MKKVFVILIMVLAIMPVKSQNYIGVGFDNVFIAYPDGIVKSNSDFIISAQHNQFDCMLSIGIFDKKPYNVTDILSVGVYGGHNWGWFTLGGHLGYEMMETRIQNMYIDTKVQEDNLVLGVYAKATIGRFLQLFTFYKLAYDNNSATKWHDRGFGFGCVVGFGTMKH